MQILYYLLLPLISYGLIMALFGVQYIVILLCIYYPVHSFFDKREKECDIRNRFSFGFGFNEKFPKVPFVLFLGIAFILKPINRITTIFGLISVLICLLYTINLVFKKALQPTNNLYFFLIGLKHYVKIKTDSRYRDSLFQAFLTNYFFVAYWFFIFLAAIVLFYALFYMGCQFLFPNSFINIEGIPINNFWEYFYLSMKTITMIGSEIVITNSWGKFIEISEILTGIFLFIFSFGFAVSTFTYYFKEFKIIYKRIERSEKEPSDFLFHVINFNKEDYYFGERKDWKSDPFSVLGKTFAGRKKTRE